MVSDSTPSTSTRVTNSLRDICSSAEDASWFRLLERCLDDMVASTDPPDEGCRGLRIFLDACQTVLQAYAPLSPPSVEQPPARAERGRLLLLASLVRDEARRKHRRSWDVDEDVTSALAKASLSYLALVEEMARLQGMHLEEIARDRDRSCRIWRQAEAFQTAIAPRQLSALLLDREDLRGRVAAFVGNQMLPDADLEAHACAVWRQVDQLSSADIDRLLGRIPRSRLRTYSDRRLRAVAEKFVEWDPLLRLIEGQGPGGEPGAAGHARLAELLQGLTSRLHRLWPGEVGGFGADDAVQETMEIVLETAGDPRRGYGYEGDLHAWLFRTAYNRLKIRARKPDLPTPVERPIRSDEDVASELEYVELLEQFQQRYLLVETFFQAQVRDRVKAIWRFMILYGQETSDSELAAWLEHESGARVPVTTLAGTRRRLRQRLDALTAVLDEPPGGAIDAPGDVAVRERIRSRFGLAKGDVPTIRHLAALGRAARRDMTLAWALLARLLVDHRESFDEAWQSITPYFGGGWSVGAEASRRRDLARSWVELPAQARLLTEVRKQTRRDRVGFLVSPCWYLAVLRGMPAPEVVLTLCPAQEEVRRIREISGHLQTR